MLAPRDIVRAASITWMLFVSVTLIGHLTAAYIIDL